VLFGLCCSGCVVVCRDRSDSNGMVIVVDVLRQRARRCIIKETPFTRKISGRDRGVEFALKNSERVE